MADEELWQTLLRFHREIVKPDIEATEFRIISSLRSEMNGHFDAIYRRLERVETELTVLSAQVARLEKRVESLDARVEAVEAKLALRSELDELKDQVARLQERIAEIEKQIN